MTLPKLTLEEEIKLAADERRVAIEQSKIMRQEAISLTNEARRVRRDANKDFIATIEAARGLVRAELIAELAGMTKQSISGIRQSVRRWEKEEHKV